MDDQQLGAAIEAERLDLGDLLDGLTAEQWATPSLCAGWTVRHVAAHLTVAPTITPWQTLREAVRARGSIHRMIDTTARERADALGDGVVGELRQVAGSRRRVMGSAAIDPLVDVLVHWQDIARPLGVDRPTSPERGVAALEHVLRVSFYGAPRRLAGTRLVATDADWSAGDGPDELHGTVGDLLLAATGREAGRPVRVDAPHRPSARRDS